MPEMSVMIRCKNCLTLNRVPLEKLQSSPLCGSCKATLDIPDSPSFADRSSFDREVAYWPETLLVEFTSAWCVYCRIFNPVVEDLARQRAGRLKVIDVDIDSLPDMAERFKVTKTPTYLVYKNGTFVVRMDGSPKDRNELIAWIDNLIAYSSYE